MKLACLQQQWSCPSLSLLVCQILPCLYDFFIYYLILVLILTALLICTENTFWDIGRDGNFVELFKKSFTLYSESGMREMMKMDIDMLRNEQGKFLVTMDFKARFHKLIVDHYLCKFDCLNLFLLALDTSNHFLHLNTAHHEESQAGGDQVERKHKKRFIWLQNLMLKFRRRQRV